MPEVPTKTVSLGGVVESDRAMGGRTRRITGHSECDLKAAENDCLERGNSIRPRVSSRVAYKAERGGNELFWSL